MMSGGAVCWKSQRQLVVALSTTEAEYIAAAECSKQAAWMRGFLFDVFYPLDVPLPFSVDNTSAIFTATGEGVKSRSKHIDRRHHYIRDMVQSNHIVVKYVPTDLMLADHLTKPLASSQFQHALELNNLRRKVLEHGGMLAYDVSCILFPICFINIFILCVPFYCLYFCYICFHDSGLSLP